MKIPEAKSLDGVFTLLPMDDVFYGEKCVAQLEEVLKRMGAEKALLITATLSIAKLTWLRESSQHQAAELPRFFLRPSNTCLEDR